MRIFHNKRIGTVVTLVIISLTIVLIFLTGISYPGDEGDLNGLGDLSMREPVPPSEILSSGRLTLPEKKKTDADEVGTEFHVPILVYHSVREPVSGLSEADRQYGNTPAQFERQMAYLESEGYESVSLGELTAAFSGDFSLPEKPFIITMDDGRDSQFVNAVPILEAYGFTATFYIFTNAIDKEGYFSGEQIRLLHDRGHEIGSHTVYHPFLTRMSSAEAQEEEIRKSKEVLETIIGAPVTTFAYPFGLFDGTTVDLVASAGYSSARGLRHDRTHDAGERYRLGAHIVTGDYSAFTAIMARPEP